jgi:hypothetical protein
MFVSEKAFGETKDFKVKKEITSDLQPLIDWLETKDPTEAYDFMCCRTCLFTQYLMHQGLSQGAALDNHAWAELHQKYRGVAAHRPRNFGAALDRAKAGMFSYDINLLNYE